MSTDAENSASNPVNPEPAAAESAPITPPASAAGGGEPVQPSAGQPASGNAPGYGTRGIKIGSQRQPGTKVQAEVNAPTRRAAFRPKPTQPGDRPRGPRSGNAPSSPAAPADGAPSESTGDRPSRMEQIAAEVDAMEVPSIPAAVREEIVRESVAVVVPSRRAALPSDLQNELDEMLAGVEFDQLIKSNKGRGETTVLEPESRHRGVVSKIHADNVFIDLGGRNQGVASLMTFAKPPEVGTPLEVVVRKYSPEDDLYEVFVPGASVDVADWSEVSEGIVVSAVITGHNKGGLECQVNRLRGFIPAGQVAIYRVEDFSQFVGQKMDCVVTEANAQRRNLVLSRRAMLEREAAENRSKLLAELEVGQTREGIVRKLMDFGAFVDLGGVDGLVHVSQLSWDRISHPRDVLTEGQKIKVRVEKIAPDTGKISLSYRDLFESPWTNAERKWPVTSVQTGTVSRIMDFGAFVKLVPGVEGLVHISELSHKRVFRVSDMVKEGQEVQVQVLSVDPEQQRMSLSMKALQAKPEPAKKETEAVEEAPEETPPPKPIVKRKTPLAGGLERAGSDGDKFGLKW